MILLIKQFLIKLFYLTTKKSSTWQIQHHSISKPQSKNSIVLTNSFFTATHLASVIGWHRMTFSNKNTRPSHRYVAIILKYRRDLHIYPRVSTLTIYLLHFWSTCTYLEYIWPNYSGSRECFGLIRDAHTNVSLPCTSSDTTQLQPQCCDTLFNYNYT